jgi:hypothetical protein
MGVGFIDYVCRGEAESFPALASCCLGREPQPERFPASTFRQASGRVCGAPASFIDVDSSTRRSAAPTFADELRQQRLSAAHGTAGAEPTDRARAQLSPTVAFCGAFQMSGKAPLPPVNRVVDDLSSIQREPTRITSASSTMRSPSSTTT